MSLYDEYNALRRLAEDDLPDSFCNEIQNNKKLKIDHEDESFKKMAEFCYATHKVKVFKQKTHRKQKQMEYMSSLDDHQAKVYKYGLIPKILKSDIRRFYPSMFAYVYNSCDYNVMMYFMKTFVSDDFLYVFKRSFKGDLCEKLELRGIEKCSKMWYDRMQDAPDVCFRLSDTQITLRADDTAMVTANFTSKGTRIIDPLLEKSRSHYTTQYVSASAFVIEQHHSKTDKSSKPQQLMPQVSDPIYCDFFDSLEFANDIISADQALDHEAIGQYTHVEAQPIEEFTEQDLVTHISDMDISVNEAIPYEHATTATMVEYPSISSSSSTSSSSSQPEYSEVFLIDELHNIPVVASPEPVLKPFQFSGTLTMHLDENSKIYLLHFSIDR